MVKRVELVSQRGDPRITIWAEIEDIHDNLEPRRLALLDVDKRRYFLKKYGSALIALSQ